MATSTVLVIGNSDGIGLGLTRLLLDRGYFVTGISRSPGPMQHPRLHQQVMDVTDVDFPRVLQRVWDAAGDIGCVVYCAGIGERTDPHTLERDRHVFEVNLMGALRCGELAIARMAGAGGGKFIVLSSQADAIVSHEATSYCASKAALSSYFEGLGLQLRRSPVRICNVRFGFVATKMARSGLQPFRISVDRAARLLLGLIEGRCPLRVTYPRRMAPLVATIALLQRIRVAFG